MVTLKQSDNPPETKEENPAQYQTQTGQRARKDEIGEYHRFFAGICIPNAVQ